MRSGFPWIFYGWWIVAAAFLMSLYIGGVVFYGFTAFFEPISRELGWNYTEISFAYSLRGIESGIFAPLAGIAADRFGLRKLIFLGVFTVILSLFLFSFAKTLSMFYLAFSLMSIGMSCCMITVPMIAIANWFRKKNGIATGIALGGFGFSGIMIPIIIKLIDKYGWRETLIILAIGMVIIAPLSLFFRHRPEQYGYIPDGISKNNSKSIKTTESLPERNVGARDALKTKAFWFIALALICHLTVLTATITHIVPALESVGVTRITAGIIAMYIPLVSIGGRLGFGWMADKSNSRKVLVIAFLCLFLSMIFVIYTSSQLILLAIPFVILFGLGYGANNTLRATIMREYFGRRNFGTIFGLLMGITSLGGLIGPVLAGRIWDTQESYHLVWVIFIIITALGLGLMILTPPINKMRKSINRDAETPL